MRTRKATRFSSATSPEVSFLCLTSVSHWCISNSLKSYFF
jgi:hypothetical protein